MWWSAGGALQDGQFLSTNSTWNGPANPPFESDCLEASSFSICLVCIFISPFILLRRAASQLSVRGEGKFHHAHILFHIFPRFSTVSFCFLNCGFSCKFNTKYSVIVIYSPCSVISHSFTPNFTVKRSA